MKNITMRLPFTPRVFAMFSNKEDQILAGIEHNQGYYEPHIMNFLARHLTKPDAVCLDIGANIGAIALAMGILAPQGRVYAFEPSSFSFPFLVQNIRINALPNITPVQRGVYDDNIEMAFTYVDFGSAWSHITTPHANNGVQEVIQCVKIDDWVRQEGLDRLDLIKLDVEGAEIHALNGARETIQRFRPDLIVEFNPKAYQSIFNEDPAKLYRLLEELFPKISVIDFNDAVIPVQSYEQLMAFYQDGREVSDLFCTF
ncbi:FkbM family methyltransferase [Paenibacillus rigui]|uniref:Methyltransferase FkbM domain-containing protein n=1 Tax=Paenibacillus rigui TaxID=554312 RepID=A0A229UUQ6_9BACL|nr:FkbM family methyltransferase [Paenibacillus rigui]OXM86649.1 hypothetical protein CF651_09375 [Paenibacillus rigui]